MENTWTKRIRYLERGFNEPPANEELLIIRDGHPISFDDIRLYHISEISDFFLDTEHVNLLAKQMISVLTGAFTLQMPIIFGVICKGPDIQIVVGTTTEAAGDALLRLLNSALRGVKLDPISREDLNLADVMKHAGLLCGTPASSDSPMSELYSSAVDTLIRGLLGQDWAYLVIAKPINSRQTTSYYEAAVKELQIASPGESASSGAVPLITDYRELVEALTKKLKSAKSSGLWNVSTCFLASNDQVLHQGLSVLNSVLSNGRSLPDPIQILEALDYATDLANLNILNDAAPSGPGKFSYPHQYLSLLSTDELIREMQLPTREAPGYRVSPDAVFGVEVGPCDEQSIVIGEVLDGNARLGKFYCVDQNDFARHTLVSGTNGSGKTNSIFQILRQLRQQDPKIPFWVIEPVKNEYRKLRLVQEIDAKDILVFTLGDETVSPFRLNPFEIREGISVQAHIIWLYSVFTASFEMWDPMPQILSTALHEIYDDKGWNIGLNSNPRGGHHPYAQPTITDLYRKIPEVITDLRYDQEISNRLKAALLVRIGSLREAGRGLMMDTRESYDFKELIRRPVVFELEKIADDEQKAFVMGILLMFLYEYYISEGMSEGTTLKHITVIEEAHRLLRNPQTLVNQAGGNTRAKAVEQFTNMLAEIRAYGEGFIIADQIPSKLALDVIKNTNLKITHRLISRDEIETMSGAMNLDTRQGRFLTSLKPGEAIVYGGRDLRPIRVQTPETKIKSNGTNRQKDDADLRDFMAENWGIPDIPHHAHRDVLQITENPVFEALTARYILSSLLNPKNMLDGWEAIHREVQKHRTDNNQNRELLRLCLIVAGDHYYLRRSTQFGIQFEDTERLVNLFNTLINAIFLSWINNVRLEPAHDTIYMDWYKLNESLVYSNLQPYAQCHAVCTNLRCYYRYHVQELLQNKDNGLYNEFTALLDRRIKLSDEIYQRLVLACQSLVKHSLATNVHDDAKKIISLCSILQVTDTSDSFQEPRTDDLIRELSERLSHIWH